MVQRVKSHWCDDHVNPYVGGFQKNVLPPAESMFDAVDAAIGDTGLVDWPRGSARANFERLIRRAWDRLRNRSGPALEFAKDGATARDVFCFRALLEDELASEYGAEVGQTARRAIERAVGQHLWERPAGRKSDSPKFENLITEDDVWNAWPWIRHPDAIRRAARWSNLATWPRFQKPWLDELPRIILVSDMGETSGREPIWDYLEKQFEIIESSDGSRHLWLWHTWHPDRIADFSRLLGRMPSNVCVMTTVTAERNAYRIDELRKVNAEIRAVNASPLWTRLGSDLDLSGVDWMIVSGEIGLKGMATPFDIRWAEELLETGGRHDVAMFIDRLGSVPIGAGGSLNLREMCGANWSEWPDHLRVREMPRAFKNYRLRDSVDAA